MYLNVRSAKRLWFMWSPRHVSFHSRDSRLSSPWWKAVGTRRCWRDTGIFDFTKISDARNWIHWSTSFYPAGLAFLLVLWVLCLPRKPDWRLISFHEAMRDLQAQQASSFNVLSTGFGVGACGVCICPSLGACEFKAKSAACKERPLLIAKMYNIQYTYVSNTYVSNIL